MSKVNTESLGDTEQSRCKERMVIWKKIQKKGRAVDHSDCHVFIREGVRVLEKLMTRACLKWEPQGTKMTC